MPSLGWFKIFVAGFFGWDLPQSLFLLGFVLHTVAFSPTLLFPNLTEGGMFRAQLMAGTRGRRGHWHPAPCPSLQAAKKNMRKNSATSRAPALQHLSDWSLCSARAGTNSDLTLALVR